MKKGFGSSAGGQRKVDRSGEKVYEIDKLVDKRYNFKRERIEYRVLWEGYGEEDAAWVSAARLVSSDDG